MNPLAWTPTIVDLAPRLVLPFSPQHALWLELTGAFVVSGVALLIAALRSARARSSQPGRARRGRPVRGLRLRPGLEGEVG